MKRLPAFFLLLLVLAGCGKGQQRPAFVVDQPGLLTSEELSRLNSQCEALYRDMNMQVMVIVLKESPADIDGEAVRLFGEHKAGRANGSKGVLFLIDPAGEQVRVEVGYGLEPIFTDGFVGYIERRQLAPFFKAGQVGPGVEATVELMVGKALGRVDEADFNVQGEYLSGGGGAKAEAPVGELLTKEGPSGIGEMFGPQPAPMDALTKYRKSLALHVKDSYLGLFTPESRIFFAGHVVTDAQQDNARRVLEATLPTAEVLSEGRLAVVRFPVSNRQASPYFLVRSEQGWMIDFASMSRCIGFNHKNEWFMRSRGHVYMFAFQGIRFDSSGFPHESR